MVESLPCDFQGLSNRISGLVATGGFANQPSKAIEDFKKVIEIDPVSADAYNNLAWLYADLETNLDQAVRLAKKAVGLAPTASNFDTLAYVYYQHKQYPQAEEAIKRAIEISPSNQKYNEMLKKIQSRHPKGINQQK